MCREQCFKFVETNFSTFENIDLPLIRIGFPDNRIDLDNSSVVASIIVLTYWTIRIVSKRNFNEYTVITELKNKMIKGGGRGERKKFETSKQN